MNADGAGQSRLTNSGYTDLFPGWSPDGKYIAFVSVRGRDAEVYVVSASGSGLTNLTNNPAADTGPVWQPKTGTSVRKPPSPTPPPPNPTTPPSPTTPPPDIATYIEQKPYAGDCQSRPSGTTCIGYDDGYIWLVYNAAIIGWDIRGSWQGHTIQVALGEKADYYHVLTTHYVREEPK
jgi:dipeptidyl aminopeptidase/acylaminoacyl peptidase